MIPKCFRQSIIAACSIAVIAGPAIAAQLLDNGGFESGSLNNWEDNSSGAARIEIVERSECSSSGNTRELHIRGNYAALLGGASPDSPDDISGIAVLSSASFAAGDGFAFIALNGLENSPSQQKQIGLRVDVVDAQTGSVLVSQTFFPTQVQWQDNCPSTPTSGQFSSHYFDTRSYTGQTIKIQFRQPIKTHNRTIFTLIDQVALFPDGEQALFFSRPYAQAGIGNTPSGTAYLSARGSFDPDHYPSVLSYSWWLKDQQYHTAQPCLNDLTEGNYQAVLYVNDGQHAISDSLQFYLPAALSTALETTETYCDFPEMAVDSLNQDPLADKSEKPSSKITETLSFTEDEIPQGKLISIPDSDSPAAPINQF